MKPNLKKWYFLFVIVGLILLFPYKTTLVPAWQVQVVDEHGKPYPKKLVRQYCDDYSLGISPCNELDADQETDANGYVVFPERTIRASIISRAVRKGFYGVMTIAHGSYGKRVELTTTGPKDYKTLEYIPGKPLPTKFVLESH
jgi:hypothetical protein